MNPRLLVLATLLLLTALPAQQHAPATPTELSLEKLDTAIETVVSGGYWERGDQDGTFRLIVLLEGWEHLSNRVLLQWIRRDGDKQELVVEKTIPIKEFPGDGFWRVNAARFQKSQIILSATSQGGGKTVFIITPAVDHQYKFSRAPN